MANNGDNAKKFTLEDKGDGYFEIAGALTFETAGKLLESGRKAFTEHSRLTIDLTGVEHSDSAGLAVLLEWVTWANHSVREINYLNIPERIVNIASISEVDGLLSAAERWRGFL